jgi:hypothetical protein
MPKFAENIEDNMTNTSIKSSNQKADDKFQIER